MMMVVPRIARIVTRAITGEVSHTTSNIDVRATDVEVHAETLSVAGRRIHQGDADGGDAEHHEGKHAGHCVLLVRVGEEGLYPTSKRPGGDRLRGKNA